MAHQGHTAERTECSDTARSCYPFMGVGHFHYRCECRKVWVWDARTARHKEREKKIDLAEDMDTPVPSRSENMGYVLCATCHEFVPMAQVLIIEIAASDGGKSIFCSKACGRKMGDHAARMMKILRRNQAKVDWAKHRNPTSPRPSSSSRP